MFINFKRFYGNLSIATKFCYNMKSQNIILSAYNNIYHSKHFHLDMIYNTKPVDSFSKVIALRRETQSAWERRAPLAPSHVKILTSRGCKIIVQPSNRRAYPMEDYINAGAIIQEDISEASLIVGVKRPANVKELLSNRTYLFFSHTHKAQPDNMSLLDAVIDKNIRLIDYEKMVDSSNQRVIAFGKYAGVAGMINILHGLGLRLLALGHHTPFMNVGMAHNYRNSGVARQAIRDVGYQISLGYLPKSIGPLTFVFTGTGNVSQGAREVFNELPHEYVEPETLPKIAKYGKMNKIYACVVSREHHVIHKERGKFDADDYEKNQQNYISNFSEKIAPYATVIVNGIYWAPNSPKLITLPEAKYLMQPDATTLAGTYSTSQPTNFQSNSASQKSLHLDTIVIPPYVIRQSQSLTTLAPATNDVSGQAKMALQSSIGSSVKRTVSSLSDPTYPYGGEGCPPLPHRLLAICDISADPGGSIEFMTECTTIDKPFCLYDADQNKNTESFTGIGILVCSIDNMPTQIPIEATDFFGGLLLPFIPEMLELDATIPFENLRNINPVIKNAIIASNGKLTPNFAYIADLRKAKLQTFKRESGKKPRILILGAGHVCGPVVEYLSRDNAYEMTIVSPWKKEIDKVLSLSINPNDKEKLANIEPIVFDVDRDVDQLEKQISNSKIVISLLPYTYHAKIAELCVKHKRNMVTTSYVSNDMRLLENKIKEAGICVMNECGLDPGVDHMLAMEVFKDIKENRKQLLEFTSFCGGLPAPEFANNPLRYKFSWFPKGVLLNTLSGSKYLKDGKVVEIQANGSLMDNPWNYEDLPAFNLESFSNRDSTVYVKEYDIPGVKTLIRGTLRYKGFCNIIKGFHLLNLFDSKQLPIIDPKAPDITWKALMCTLLNKPTDILLDTLKNLVFDKVLKDSSRVEAFQELGLFSDQLVEKKGTLIDTVSNYLANLLSYGKDEKDMIILRHKFTLQKDKLNPLEKEITSVTMIVYGEPNGHTAMAKTVGYPCGIAAKMILEGEIQNKGITLPITREIYKPILDRLAQEGINAKTETKVISTSPSHKHAQRKHHLVG